MADKEEQEKSTEQAKNIPSIEVTEENVSGGSEDAEGGKKGVFRSLADKMRNIGQGKRAKSKSPETPEDKTCMGGERTKESFKMARPSSPSKREEIKNMVKSFFRSKSGNDEDMDNLCEEEVTEHSRVASTHLSPPEEDFGIASPSEPVTETMAEKCESYDKSSSVSSAPSGYSSLPDDDYETVFESPGDLESPKDAK